MLSLPRCVLLVLWRVFPPMSSRMKSVFWLPWNVLLVGRLALRGFWISYMSSFMLLILMIVVLSVPLRTLMF